MRKTIDFTDTVKSQIDYIQKKRGLKNFTAALHSIISEYYEDKYFTKYAQRGAANDPALRPEDLTQEQMCEMQGGKVLSGGRCELPDYQGSGLKYDVPLSMMGTKSAAGDYRIKK